MAFGGGIWNEDGAITITNSIVAGNTAGGGSPDINPGAGIFSVNFSLLGTAVTPDAGGAGNLFDDTPPLDSLADNGGLTQTHAILAGSIAIDAGDPNSDVGDIPTDQRGDPFVRRFGSRVDIGAFERQSLSLIVDTTSDVTDGDYSAGQLSLREAVGLANSNFGADTIAFDAALSGQKITLGGTELVISDALMIDATALAHDVTIDADGLSRIFSITAATGDFTLSGLTLTRGLATVTPDIGFNGGGAIRSLTSGNLTLDRSTVSGSRASIGFARGGGIFSLGDVTLIGSTIIGNNATGMGGSGGGLHSLGVVRLATSTVSGNSTTGLVAGGGGGGGGIFSLGDVLLTSSTVSGNSTTGDDDDGGGIRSYGEVTLTSSTVTDNQASSSSRTGGGIWNDNDPITLNNSIVAGNTAGGGMNDIAPGSGTLEVNFSLIQQTGLTFTGGNNIIGQSANLAPLANNGGPTETHALLATSAAIDAGGTSALINDQRGAPFVRVFDDPDAPGMGRDMGAYERQMFSPVVDTTSDVIDGDFSAGQFSLREAIELVNNNPGAETITFDAALSGDTITLSGTELEVTDALTIDATALAQNVTIDANAASRIFNITATTGNFTLAGLTLTGGRSTESFDGGGAIRSSTTDNLTIDQSTISGNSTDGTLSSGGGIYALGAVTLANSTVNENSTSGIAALGGGIFSSGGITLTSSTVSGNRTTGELASGGGIRSTDYVRLTSSTVTENSTMGDNADGGGISTLGAVTLASSTVSRNRTTGDNAEGGGMYASGSVALTSTTVSGNSTADMNADGGGIFSTGDVTLTSSTLTDNHVNHATASGGGIFNSDTITLNNSIVAGNTAGGGMNDIRPGSGTLDVNFSLIQQTGLTITGGDNIIGQSANVGPLASNGGPTWTHALASDSPALDAGDPAILFDANEFDQRGAPFVRVFDGGMNGLRIDMGAYERQTVAGLNLVVNTLIDENDGNYTAGNLSLREAVGLANGSIGDDTITFDAAVFEMPQTMLLNLGEFGISEVVSIDGPGQALLTIDAQQQSRIFDITATTGDFTLAGLTLSGGRTVVDSISSVGTGSGGAVRSLTTGNLTIDQSTITRNSTEGNYGRGGGLFSTRHLTLTDSIVSNNSTSGIGASGGGVFAFSATLTGSTVSENSTTGGSSAAATAGGSIPYVILHSTKVGSAETVHRTEAAGSIHSTVTSCSLTARSAETMQRAVAEGLKLNAVSRSPTAR